MGGVWERMIVKIRSMANIALTHMFMSNLDDTVQVVGCSSGGRGAGADIEYQSFKY